MMTPQVIRKYGNYKFGLALPDTPILLRLDFEPIIKHFHLKGNFCMVHWQAKPRGYRRWGIFQQHFGETQYMPFEGYRVHDFFYHCGLQLDETTATTVPTAVIVYPGCRCFEDGSIGILDRAE